MSTTVETALRRRQAARDGDAHAFPLVLAMIVVCGAVPFIVGQEELAIRERTSRELAAIAEARAAHVEVWRAAHEEDAALAHRGVSGLVWSDAAAPMRDLLRSAVPGHPTARVLLLATAPALTVLVDSDGPATELPAPIRERLGAALRTFAPSLDWADEGGERMVAGVSRVSGTGWAVVVSVSLDEVFGPLRTHGFTLLLIAGVLVAAIAWLTFLSWRRRATEELRAREERLRLVLQATDEAIWDWDLEAGTVYLSERWEALTGLPAREFRTAERLRALVHPDDLPAFEAALEAALAGTAPGMELEYRIRGGGAWRWVHDRAKVVERGPGPAGAPLRVVGAIRDVTAQRTLEARVRLSDRMASLGTIAAGVVHEMNNALACIVAHLDYLSGEVKLLATPAAREDPAMLDELLSSAADARAGAERARALVRDLGVFTRPDDVREPVDVAEAVDSALRLARPLLDRRARVVTRLAATLPVRASIPRLAHVVLNLLVNAAQSLERGPEHDEIAIVTASAGGVVAIEVRDTGRGLAPDAVARVFHPFRGGAGAHEGPGLGLAACHEVVAALGGRIEVESEPGRGTVFRVLLPGATRSAPSYVG